MEKFDLSIWLKDKSRKVVTRDGREVTIEKTDIHIHGMSHMILGKYSDIYEIWHGNGRINYTGSDCNLDLFFADEEEELTEFEKQLGVYIYYPRLSCGFNEEEKKYIKDAANTLLDLARKELIEELSDDNFTIDFAISKGKQDVLETLPKWKKANEHKDLEKHIAILEEGKVLLSNYLEEGDYYIELEDLKTLPKEE